MSIFRMFRGTETTDEDKKKIEGCFENIKRKVSEISGVSGFIKCGDNGVAFSGTEDKRDLVLSLYIEISRGKRYLSASMEDRLSWYEWEYKSQEEFEDSIVEFITEKINKTIKTITETKKHKYIKITEYYLDKETNEWVLMSDDKYSNLIVRPFIEEDSLEEEIREYYLR